MRLAQLILMALMRFVRDSAEAASINVLVATNFTEPQKMIAAFRQKIGHEAVLSFDASGTFYRQTPSAAF